MAAREKIGGRLRLVIVVEALHDHELHLHAAGQNALDEDAGLLACAHIFAQLGETGEVRRKLDEDPVGFDAPDDARHGFPGAEALGVLRPGAKQLLVAQRDPVLLLGADDGADIHAHGEALARVVDARNGDRVDRQQGDDAAADVRESAERLEMGDAHVDHVAARQAGYVLREAALLRLAAREHRRDPPCGVADEISDDKAHRLVDARDDGDVAHGPLADAERALLARDDAAHAL